MPLTRAAAAGLLLVSTIAALACTRRDAPPRAPQRETVAPPAPPPTPDSFLVALTTSRGPVTVVVRRSWAPHGADRFYTLEIGRARLNSSHVRISYAVFCLKKKKQNTTPT